MTALEKSALWIGPEEYLAWEAAQDERSEYIEGQVFAMAEASPDHGRIAGNIFAALHSQLRGKACEAFVETMKVKIPPQFSNAFYYPDVVVVCEPADKTRSIFENPTVIFEVLSSSTEHIDRREKTPAYMHLPSLQAYAMVAQDRTSVLLRRRVPDGWTMEEFTKPDDVLPLGSIGCSLRLDLAYERVSWRRDAAG